MGIEIHANTWLMKGIIEFLNAHGYNVFMHVIDAGGDSIDIIVIDAPKTDKTYIIDKLKSIGLASPKFKVIV